GLPRSVPAGATAACSALAERSRCRALRGAASVRSIVVILRVGNWDTGRVVGSGRRQEVCWLASLENEGPSEEDRQFLNNFLRKSDMVLTVGTVWRVPLLDEGSAFDAELPRRPDDAPRRERPLRLPHAAQPRSACSGNRWTTGFVSGCL